MSDRPFYDQQTLAKSATDLGENALKLGLISSFVVRYFSDNQQFYIPNEVEAEPLTPEEAYLYLKKLINQASERGAVKE